MKVRQYVRLEMWTLADDTELRDLADREPIVAKALQYCRAMQYGGRVPFFDILDHVPRAVVDDNPVSLSRGEPIRHYRPQTLQEVWRESQE